MVVQQALTEGLGATAALRVFRAAGGKVRTQSWYRAFGEAERALAEAGSEASANLDARPGWGRIETVHTPKATGYGHIVHVVGVNPKTGEETVSSITIHATTRLTRRQAVETAVQRVAENQERYENRPVGGVYIGTQHYVV